MKKVKILGTALAAIVGISGAVAMQFKAQPNFYKLVGTEYRKVLDDGNAPCSPSTSEPCLYLINSDADVIDQSETPTIEDTQGTGSYQGMYYED